MDDEPNDVEQNHPQLSDELQNFASDLARLIPRDDRLDRERLAYFAGQVSVAPVTHRSAKLLGLPLESRVWPAAFAAMTAIAASLLIALFVRPEVSGSRPLLFDGPIYDSQQVTFERDYDRGLLSTRDAYRPDVDMRLLEHEVHQVTGNTVQAQASAPSPRRLTPNSWHQVINETEPGQPSPHDASGLFKHRGANS